MLPKRSNILVVQWARLGDLFHSRSLCAITVRKYCPANVTLCFDSRYESVVRDFPEVDNLLPVNLGGLTAQFRTDASLPDAFADLIDLQSQIEAYDVVVNLTNHAAAIQFASAVNAPLKLGYGFDSTGVLQDLEDAVRNNRSPKHVADIWSSLVAVNSSTVQLMTIGTNVKETSAHNTAIICDAGSKERSLSSVSIENIIETIRKFRTSQIVLLGSSTSPFVATHPSVSDLRGSTSLSDLKALLSNAEFVIGPDTGALHYAAALGKPVLGIYLDGASPVVTGPLTTMVGSITATSQCSAFQAELRSTLCNWLNGAAAQQLALSSSQASRCPLSIVITEYGQTHYTDSLLKCLKDCTLPVGSEIIVMSSGLGQSDLQVALTRQYLITDMTDGKRSFAEVCNRGALLARGEWLLLLNDDCEIESSAFEALWNCREQNTVVGPILRNWDGTLQSAGFYYDGTQVHEVCSTGLTLKDSVHGVSAAAMLINRAAFYSLGGFDRGFRNGYEDVDLCLRARTMGISTKVASCSVTHFKGSSPERYDNDNENLIRLNQRWGVMKPRSKDALRLSHATTPLVIVSDEQQESAGALLRWVDPLKRCGLRLGKDFSWLNVADTDEESMRVALEKASAVIVFRAVSNELMRLQLLNWQTEQNGPLCYDCDDLLIGRFQKGSLREQTRSVYESGVREIAMQADILIAPNKHLFEQFGEAPSRQFVIDTIPLQIHLATRAKRQARGEFRIGYAGSTVHQTDLAIVTTTLEQLLEADESIRFYWWGAHPAGLSNHPQVRRGGDWMSDYSSHVRRIQGASIDLWIAPLGEAPHNSMRSAIKAFEYIGCGAPCLFSNVDPFRRNLCTVAPHLLVDNTTSAWAEAIMHWRSADELSTYHKELARARSLIGQLAQNRTAYRHLIKMLLQRPGASIKDMSRALAV